MEGHYSMASVQFEQAWDAWVSSSRGDIQPAMAVLADKPLESLIERLPFAETYLELLEWEQLIRLHWTVSFHKNHEDGVPIDECQIVMMEELGRRLHTMSEDVQHDFACWYGELRKNMTRVATDEDPEIYDAIRRFLAAAGLGG